jgi:hypothetical protein
MTSLFDYQKKAVSQLKTGAILWGGVGSGKSITALAYFYQTCGGKLDPMTMPTKPRNLYVITTPRKRDSMDWLKEAANFGISDDPKTSVGKIQLIIDSWNNISKYKDVKDAFFIFDEQRVVGSGVWVKSFIKVAKANAWILISATPGDTWMDYVPVFVANGFYKNRTEFVREHVVYNNFTSYPKIDRYVNTGKLVRLKNEILVKMDYEKKTINNVVNMTMPYNTNLFNEVYKKRWNPYKKEPLKNASAACYAMRRVVNSDPSRFDAVLKLLELHKKLIIFYNFDYELEILRRLNDVLDVPVAEYNGHMHEPIPIGESWIYITHYISAGEAWNCIETNATILYSRNYSYKATIQAMGRIDRQNTPYRNLYYYFLTSDSPIDRAIEKAFGEKKNFNERKFVPF